jgi:hypothetical protein
VWSYGQEQNGAVLQMVDALVVYLTTLFQYLDYIASMIE